MRRMDPRLQPIFNTTNYGVNTRSDVPAMPGDTTPQTPLPDLTTEELAYYSQQRRQAKSNFRRTRNQTKDQRKRLRAWFDNETNRIDRGAYRAGQDLRQQLSEGGLGFSPMFVNRGMQEVAQRAADANAAATGERASQLEALTRMLQDAKALRQNTLAEIARQEMLARTGRLPQYVTGGR